MAPALLFAWGSFAVASAAALFDWRARRIPNVLTLGALIAAPVLHALVQPSSPLRAAGFSVVGAMACAVVPLGFFLAGWIGAGDVKLVAAVGAIVGPSLGLESIFFAFLSGSAIAIVRLAYEGVLLRSLANGAMAIFGLVRPLARRTPLGAEMARSLRFGPFVLVGSTLTLLLHGGLR